MHRSGWVFVRVAPGPIAGAACQLVMLVVRLVVRSGVNSCGTCCRGAHGAMSKLLVEARCDGVVPPRNEKVVGSIPTGGSTKPPGQRSLSDAGGSSFPASIDFGRRGVPAPLEGVREVRAGARRGPWSSPPRRARDALSHLRVRAPGPTLAEHLVCRVNSIQPAEIATPRREGVATRRSVLSGPASGSRSGRTAMVAGVAG